MLREAFVLSKTKSTYAEVKQKTTIGIQNQTHPPHANQPENQPVNKPSSRPEICETKKQKTKTRAAVIRTGGMGETLTYHPNG